MTAMAWHLIFNYAQIPGKQTVDPTIAASVSVLLLEKEHHSPPPCPATPYS